MTQEFCLSYLLKHDKENRKNYSVYNIIRLEKEKNTSPFVSNHCVLTSNAVKHQSYFLPLTIGEYFSIVKNSILDMKLENCSLFFCGMDFFQAYKAIEDKKIKVKKYKENLKIFIRLINKKFTTNIIDDNFKHCIHLLMNISDNIIKKEKSDIFYSELESLFLLCKKNNIHFYIDEEVDSQKFHFSLKNDLKKIAFEIPEKPVFDHEKANKIKIIQEKRFSSRKEENTVIYNIYTDASIDTDNKKAGFGAVVKKINNNENQHILKMYGMSFFTDINYSTQYGEMKAILESINSIKNRIFSLKENALIRIYTDNLDCKNILHGARDCPLELKLIKQKIESINIRKMFFHVKAHNGDLLNEKSDRLAYEGKKLIEEKIVIFKKKPKNKKSPKTNKIFTKNA